MRGEFKDSHRANLTVAMDKSLLDQLKNEAKKSGHSINAKTNLILSKHLQFYRHVEEQRGFIVPAKVWKEIVNAVDEKKMVEILESAGTNTFLIVFEHNNVPVTMENLSKYLFETMSLWAGCYHRFSSFTDKEGYLNLVFEHDFGLKWSKAMGFVFADFIQKALGLSTKLKPMSSTMTIKVKA